MTDFNFKEEHKRNMQEIQEMCTFHEGIEYYLPLAKRGDHKAQYKLGRIYRDGLADTEKDWAKSLEWFSILINNPQAEKWMLAEAYRYIGEFYWKCEFGIVQNKELSIKMLTKAIELGDWVAEYRINDVRSDKDPKECCWKL